MRRVAAAARSQDPAVAVAVASAVSSPMISALTTAPITVAAAAAGAVQAGGGAPLPPLHNSPQLTLEVATVSAAAPINVVHPPAPVPTRSALGSGALAGRILQAQAAAAAAAAEAKKQLGGMASAAEGDVVIGGPRSGVVSSRRGAPVSSVPVSSAPVSSAPRRNWGAAARVDGTGGGIDPAPPAPQPALAPAPQPASRAGAPISATTAADAQVSVVSYLGPPPPQKQRISAIEAKLSALRDKRS